MKNKLCEKIDMDTKNIFNKYNIKYVSGGTTFNDPFYDSCFYGNYKGIDLGMTFFKKEEGIDFEKLIYKLFCCHLRKGNSEIVVRHLNERLCELFESMDILCGNLVCNTLNLNDEEYMNKFISKLDRIILINDEIDKEILKVKKNISFMKYDGVVYFEGFDIIKKRGRPSLKNIKNKIGNKLIEIKFDEKEIENCKWYKELIDLNFKINFKK